MNHNPNYIQGTVSGPDKDPEYEAEGRRITIQVLLSVGLLIFSGTKMCASNCDFEAGGEPQEITAPEKPQKPDKPGKGPKLPVVASKQELLTKMNQRPNLILVLLKKPTERIPKCFSDPNKQRVAAGLAAILEREKDSEWVTIGKQRIQEDIKNKTFSSSKIKQYFSECGMFTALEIKRYWDSL